MHVIYLLVYLWRGEREGRNGPDIFIFQTYLQESTQIPKYSQLLLCSKLYAVVVYGAAVAQVFRLNRNFNRKATGSR